MSTVGFGDLTPTNAVGKVAAVLYLPLAVSALADAISDAGLIKLRRRIRETDYAADADVLLMREAARENDAHETLTEAEFLISVLLEHEIVDETTLSAIRQQFRHICRRSPDADPLLDAKLVFSSCTPARCSRPRPSLDHEQWRRRQRRRRRTTRCRRSPRTQ